MNRSFPLSVAAVALALTSVIAAAPTATAAPAPRSETSFSVSHASRVAAGDTVTVTLTNVPSGARGSLTWGDGTTEPVVGFCTTKRAQKGSQRLSGACQQTFSHAYAAGGAYDISMVTNLGSAAVYRVIVSIPA